MPILPFSNTSQLPIYDYIKSPPPVMDEGKSGWKDRHAQVLNYCRSWFCRLSSDPTGEAWRKNCTRYAKWDRGSKDIFPSEEESKKTQVNLIQMFLNLKYSQLLSDKLKVHYTTDKNFAMPNSPSSYDLAVTVSRAFDWHERISHRLYLQNRLEFCTMLYGMTAVLWLPYHDLRDDSVIPARGQYLDPRTIFFESRWDDYRDLPAFATRTVESGFIQDADHEELLKRRNLERFPRGSAEFSTFKGIVSQTPTYTKNWLSRMGGDDVEVIRLWIQDRRRIKADVFYPTVKNETGELENVTPEVVEAFQQADSELPNILMDGALPMEGEHHYVHYMRHLMQVEQFKTAMENGQMPLTDVQVAYMENHMAATQKLHKIQPPDEQISIPMFKGGWRYIKIIGNQVIQDGDIGLEFDQFPVAFFQNRINPESLIGISDIETLQNMQNYLNKLIHHAIEVSEAAAYPPTKMPEYLRDVEAQKKGKHSIWYFREDDPNIGQWGTMASVNYPQHIMEIINLMSSFMQMVSGANSVVRGEVPSTRTSGIGMAQLQAAAGQRFTVSQYMMNDGWERSCEIILAQMKQYWHGERMIPVVGEEYAQAVPLLMNMVDPHARLIVERIPRTADLQGQAYSKAIQAGMLMLQSGFPADIVFRVLSTQYEAGSAIRVFGEIIQKYDENQQLQQEMQMQRQLPMMQAAQKGAQGTANVVRGK